MTRAAPRPAWRTCARKGCGQTFAPKRVTHRYCSSRCQGNVARHGPVMERPEKGGIARDGSIISGTAVERPEIDPLAPPQGDPRFW